MSSQNFTDKDIMTDQLSSQKFITDSYNVFASECASSALKTEFMNILSEEHQIQFELFSEMQKKGWYSVDQAEQQKIAQAKQKFQNQQQG